MLALQDVSLQIGDGSDAPILLGEASLRFPRKHFAAILGPSGCGKSTLLKLVAGLKEPTTGRVEWEGRDLARDGDMDPHEIGYVPQFSIAYELLTVWESVESSLRLRIAGLDEDARRSRIDDILQQVGLGEIADREVRVLSGGQRRRLALAVEMVSTPHLLLCDEVTSGLDPKAEDEITRLMYQLSRRDERIVLSVTHSLRHLSLFDSVLVLYHGRVAYHGPPDFLFHYFNVTAADALFPRLAERTPEDWHRSWQKNRGTYYDAAMFDSEAVTDEVALEEGAGGLERSEVTRRIAAEGTREPGSKRVAVVPTPSLVTQFAVLLARRWRIFLRDRGQLWLQVALLLGFPLLVVIFALEGLPQIKNLSGVIRGNIVQQFLNEAAQKVELMHNGSLVSGLVMFQVILLALMGSNNAAREIAGERLIFEKEKFAGVRASAYVASKAAFLGLLVLAQSVWMGVFVHLIVRFPGNLGMQIALLALVNGALTAICLAISSLTKSAEQASLVSVYLVGFQLPLSGAVLALPAALSWLTRPFIASYWGWSGYIQTLRDTRFYEAILSVTQTKLAAAPLCLWVLACHLVIGLLLTYAGCKNSRWE
jgi:ABC-type multidrug transport system ATPase subunit